MAHQRRSTADISPLQHLINLTEVRLDNNQISSVDVLHLRKLSKLTYLGLGNNPISKTEIKRLKQSLRKCHIDFYE